MKLRHLFLYCCCLFAVKGFAQSLIANFKSDITSGCSPIIVNFQDQSSGNPARWQWDFGNGSTSTRKSPSTTYINSGTYTVTLTVFDANGGSNTIVKTAYITVYNEPVANFGANRFAGCSPVRVQFTDLSTAQAGNNIVSWAWNFGDGNTSTQEYPVNTYKSAGSYTVSLKITTDKGCVKVITKPNYINISPGVQPDFNFNDPGVCSAPETIAFNNASSGPGNLTYHWTFGNGNTSNAQNPSTLYTTNGTYPVSLAVTSDQGCTDTIVHNVQVGRVNTNFTIPASICPKSPVQFLNTSTPRPLKSYWQFGNGTTDTLRNGTTTYASRGNYTVTLINTYTVCTDTLRKLITVQAAPVISFNASDTAKCQPTLNVNFTNSTNGTSYVWDFGDSTTSTQANPSHAYTKFGTYNVQLIAASSNGCTDTLTKPAYIKIRKPIISFPNLPTMGCIPFTTTLSAVVQGVDTVVSYLWDYGDTTGTSTLAKPTHTYTRQGTYAVTLTVKTSTGCTETYTLKDAVMVGSKPTAAFTSDVTTACADPGIQFINQSTGATKYLWSFSDGTSSSEKNPKHTFTDTGWISVTLNAINNGCADTLIKKKYAYVKPSVSKFNYRPDCNNKLLYTFTDQSIGAATWVWTFGDGSPDFSGQTPPPHQYPALGSYNVSLKTTNGSCSYTLTQTILIADQTPNFSTNAPEGCKPFVASVTAATPNAGLVKKYVWDFGDGTPADSAQGANAQHTYIKTGSYNVSLMTIDTFGCQHTIAKNSFFRANGPVAKFGSSSNSGCKGLTVTFSDSTQTDGTSAIVSWKWYFGDGTVQTYTAPPFKHTYDSVGDYDVKLVVKDAKGCIDSVLYRAFVKISTLKIAWTSDGVSCPSTPINFQNQTVSDFPFSSFWNFGDGQTSTAANPGHLYVDTGFYNVQLVVTDILGCQDSLKIDSAVHIAKPRASFTANNFTTYCTPFEAHFFNTSYFINGGYWDLGPGHGTSGETNPSTYYTTAGTYPIKLVVSSPGGCLDSITHNLIVHNPNDATLTYSPLTGCTPRTVNFDAFSPMNGQFIWDFGDGNVTDTTINAIKHLYTDFGNFIPTVILREPSGTCVIPLVGKQTIKLLGVHAKYTLSKNLFCDSGTIRVLDSTTFNDPIQSYDWNFGDSSAHASSQNPSHFYVDTGLYKVTLIVKTQSGCNDTLSKGPIRVVPVPHFTLQTDSAICLNDRVLYQPVLKIVDSSTVHWLWTFPNGNTSQVQNPPVQQYTQAGLFSLSAVAINGSGCADSVRRSLLVNPLPVITMPPPITKLVGVPVTLSPTYSSNVIKYRWTPSNTLSCSDCPAPVTTTKFPTKYTVIATDSNSCRAAGSVQVNVICKGATIFMPNTFSPNGDGNNDVLYLRGVGLDRVKTLRIFNRWGEVVFEQRDFPVNTQSAGWNGMYKGAKAKPDVYIYQVEVFCENGELIKFEGNVTLIL